MALFDKLRGYAARDSEATLGRLRDRYERLMREHRAESPEFRHLQDQILDLDPTDFRLWHNKGQDLFGEKKIPEALECLETAIRLCPTYAHAWYLKARCLESLNSARDAVGSYRNAINFDLSEVFLAECWYFKARLEDSLGQPREAVASYQAALHASPGKIGYVTAHAKEIAARIRTLQTQELSAKREAGK